MPYKEHKHEVVISKTYEVPPRDPRDPMVPCEYGFKDTFCSLSISEQMFVLFCKNEP